MSSRFRDQFIHELNKKPKPPKSTASEVKFTQEDMLELLDLMHDESPQIPARPDKLGAELMPIIGTLLNQTLKGYVADSTSSAALVRACGEKLVARCKEKYPDDEIELTESHEAGGQRFHIRYPAFDSARDQAVARGIGRVLRMDEHEFAKIRDRLIYKVAANFHGFYPLDVQHVEGHEKLLTFVNALQGIPIEFHHTYTKFMCGGEAREKVISMLYELRPDLWGAGRVHIADRAIDVQDHKLSKELEELIAAVRGNPVEAVAKLEEIQQAHPARKPHGRHGQNGHANGEMTRNGHTSGGEDSELPEDGEKEFQASRRLDRERAAARFNGLASVQDADRILLLTERLMHKKSHAYPDGYNSSPTRGGVLLTFKSIDETVAANGALKILAGDIKSNAPQALVARLFDHEHPMTLLVRSEAIPVILEKAQSIQKPLAAGRAKLSEGHGHEALADAALLYQGLLPLDGISMAHLPSPAAKIGVGAAGN